MLERTVCFRKFENGDVIALFPDQWEGTCQCMSYMHVGQHGGADRQLLIELDRCEPDEYKALLAEIDYIYRDEVNWVVRDMPTQDDTEKFYAGVW
jgi:hypothetical protein